MKKKVVSYFILALFVIAGLMILCSDNMAGGTGVGNPGGTAISIIADTGITPLSRSVSYRHHSDKSDKKIPIKDEGDLIFYVEKASVRVENIRFVLAEDDIDPNTLLDSNSILYVDGEDLALDGPFEFDAITGFSNPDIENLKLPEAKYRGMKLLIEPGDVEYSVEMGGTFTYLDTVRIFIMKFDLTRDVFYKYKGPPFLISEEDSTEFRILMNASVWLDELNIGEMLKYNGISIVDGKLIIDNTTNSKDSKKIKQEVKKNIFKSGVLLITTINSK